MNKQFIEQLNDCELSFYINFDASGIDNDDDNLSADEFDNVVYNIKDGKLLSWYNEYIMDLSDIDDSWWDEGMDPELDGMTWFECFVTELTNHILSNELTGYPEFRNLIIDERKLLVLLKDSQENIIEQIDEFDIYEQVDC